MRVHACAFTASCVLLFLCVASTAACTRCGASEVLRDATPATNEVMDVALGGETMGSTWHVKVRVGGEVDGKIGARAHTAEGARELQEPIELLLERVNDQMSTYRPRSEISRFNAHASTTPFPVSPEFAAVVVKALEVGEATDGAFDITLDPLINLWGFDRRGARDRPPSAREIAAARQHTGLSLLRVEGTSLVKLDPQVTINLGGIAAGWAVDEVARMLDARGFHDFMIEVTGEVRAKGRNAKGAPWKIGVQVPDIDSSDVLMSVPLDDRSLTTSGTYHNFFDVPADVDAGVNAGIDAGGDAGVDAHGAVRTPKKRFHHILDPKTGAPAETDLVSVTVMYSDAVTADGYDTPFLIVGERRAREIVAATPGMAALFIHRDATTGRLTARATAGFPSLQSTK